MTPAERAAELLPCSACGNSGQVPLGEHFVTRDMAIDAGDRSLEGMSIGVEYGECKECPWEQRNAVAAALAEKDAEIERARKAVPDDFLLQSARATMELRAEATALRKRVAELEAQITPEGWVERSISKIEAAARVEGRQEAMDAIISKFREKNYDFTVGDIRSAVAALERGGKE